MHTLFQLTLFGEVWLYIVILQKGKNIFSEKKKKLDWQTDGMFIGTYPVIAVKKNIIKFLVLSENLKI